MSVIGKDVVKVEIDDEYRYEYLEDGSRRTIHIKDDEDRVVDLNEVKTYFKHDYFRTVKKDKQGRVLFHECNLRSLTKLSIEQGYEGNANVTNKIYIKFTSAFDNSVTFDDNQIIGTGDGKAEPIELFGQQMIAEYKNGKLQRWDVVDENGQVTGERSIEYYPNGQKHHEHFYQNLNEGGKYEYDIHYYENGNIEKISILNNEVTDDCMGNNVFWEEKYNKEGVLTYMALGLVNCSEKSCDFMEEYDETGTRLIRSIEPGEENHADAYKHIDYDEKMNPLVIAYKDSSEKILRIIDNNEKAYPSGQKKFEINADGSKTKFYETGEVLSQTDKDGKETFYYKDGKERMVVEADGTKNVTYDGGQFLLISGRHCDKNGEYGSLSKLGEKQAENIGKFIAYASQGKISGLPQVILPEVSSSSGPGRVLETDKLILETINTTLQADNKCEGIMPRYAIEECNHEANAELSIHSMDSGYDTADDSMGSIAFSVVGRDGFVIDRVVFNAEQIAKEVERVEKQEKLMQQTKRKIEKFKEETLERDRANSRIALLREVLKDNVSDKKGVVNPKRSEGDKKVIRKVINETLGDGRK